MDEVSSEHSNPSLWSDDVDYDEIFSEAMASANPTRPLNSKFQSRALASELDNEEMDLS